MAFTFVDVVNSSLKRAGQPGGLATSTRSTATGGDFATETFTDSARQTTIDVMIQVWQEVAHEMFGMGLFPEVAASATVILVAGQREYSLPSDFERFAGDRYETRVFRATSGLTLAEYRGGYDQMLADQPVATDWLGEPLHWAFSPVTRATIRFDYEPTADEAGFTYNALYMKRIGLTSTMATETLPFNDSVADMVIPVVADEWGRAMKNDRDPEKFRRSLGIAVGTAAQVRPRVQWGRGNRM